MEVDEGNQKVQRHANFEAVNDEEFFEFEEVESHYNNTTEDAEDTVTSGKGTPTTQGMEETPQCRFCWSTKTEINNPLG